MKRVFLSFRVEDKPQVNGLRLIAYNPNIELDFYDESVRRAIKSNDPVYVKRKIREKITRCSVVLCLLSKDTYKSDWVNWEIEQALIMDKRVVAMGLPGHPGRLKKPEALSVAGLDWHAWDTKHLTQILNA